LKSVERFIIDSNQYVAEWNFNITLNKYWKISDYSNVIYSERVNCLCVYLDEKRRNYFINNKIDISTSFYKEKVIMKFVID
jgi:hypothetical protein